MNLERKKIIEKIGYAVIVSFIPLIKSLKKSLIWIPKKQLNPIKIEIGFKRDLNTKKEYEVPLNLTDAKKTKIIKETITAYPIFSIIFFLSKFILKTPLYSFCDFTCLSLPQILLRFHLFQPSP